MSFVHLHTHSEYSLLDGANRIPDLVGKVRELGMDSLAITDHGNLHAAWSFYQQAKTQGIRPILGFEAYVAFGPRQERERPSWAPANYSHLVLLAKNQRGYRNLIALSSAGHVEGYYRRPRIDRQLLAERADGIVCLAACLSGEVALWLRRGNYERARETAEWFARTFGPDGYWLEVQDHGIDDERVVRDGMFQLGEDLGLPIVATNDAHYLEREDHEAHDCLLAIGTGKDLDDPNRFRFFGSESYVKTEAEMAELFPGRPDVLENTAQVAALCEFDFEKRYFLPAFPREDPSQSEEDLLVALARAGSARRYGDPLPAAVEERLTYELGVITKTGYSGYFLIVQDFIAAARARGIPVGPGRGSAAGSLVAYALGITDIDPLKFDLLFERFLNPERVSMPDIDVDFCFERRGEVIEYVRERYGRDSVGQIITFGTLKARAAVRDIARVLGVSVAEADRIAKLIPSSPGYQLSVSEAVQRVPELRELVRDNPTLERLADLACRVEGLARHASVHAAGVVIAPGPLHEYVPVCRPPQRGSAANGDETIITQYDMVALEKVGMLKMDFLGLKTLTVIHDALESIERRHGTTLDLATLDLNDPDTYVLLRAGRTAGVFQFESSLATDMLRQLRVDRFDDLVATNALVRPGPLDSGMHQRYTRRKRGEEEVRYPLPELEGVLAPTYGVILYQEQVMRIAHELAGFSLAEADVMRKAVGKKDQELIDRELRHFAERCVERGHPRRVIDDLVGQIATFGRYGFNKSHSVAYSLLSFQTAWLKAHYPAEFMAAQLSSEIGDTDKVVGYINEAREMGIAVLPPSINQSGRKFTVTGDREIRFGLGAVRNVGRGAIESIIDAREADGPFDSLTGFCDRIDLRLCNKRVVESLIAAGALDDLPGHRAQLTLALEPALREAQLRDAERQAGQVSLFGDTVPTHVIASVAELPGIPAWSEAERLTKEKEVIGFFISGHPLERFRSEVQLFGARSTATLGEWSEHRVTVAAVVTAVKRRISRKTGSEYARVTLEDFHGTAEAIVFPDAWSKLSEVIVPDAALLLTGGHSARDRGEERAPFIVEGAEPLAELRTTGALGVAIVWRKGQGPDPDAARAIKALCTAHPGPSPVYVHWNDGNGSTARLRARESVALDPEFLNALRELLGPNAVELVRAS
ncbi:MAG TPA: DNA polymerase III subunit alpha [Gemmatimonadales bacterium]|jgi:DNA polymerase-3 subunit alpha